MSKQSILEYYNKVERYKRFGGSGNESNIRRAFANLLEEYCNAKNLELIDELHLKGSQKRPDGTVKNALKLDWGYWESKDPKDDLDTEISKKIALGYPTFNLIFENSEIIVLFQENKEVLRGQMKDVELLNRVLTAFVSYERPEVRDYRIAIAQFSQDIPSIVLTLRQMFAQQHQINPQFKQAFFDFWEICRKSINPDIKEDSIIEMLLQHILTDEIFTSIFNDSAFHRENNIAMKLQNVINTFFTGALRRNTLASIDSYYLAIKAEASRIHDHHEKQRFLKVVYENFYKAYNPKVADKLGIVYTPSEIVQFMIQSTDYLLEKYFNRNLADKNVEILDPATGTGTFIVDLIDYLPPQYLEYKYKNEIHANEVAILPYYIANLNIEYTYQQKMGKYEPFENIIFVDTLDNFGFGFAGKQQTIEGFGFSAENIERIKRQNQKKISVILGNPPYNANQQNENDDNKNRFYPEIDKRISDTYIKFSSAQKTKQYDMYKRFIRWASDRIADNGIISFVCNRSFIDKKQDDGFRKVLEKEFDYVYVVDLGGDLRTEGSLAVDNVFSIKIGISIIFLVKKSKED